MTQPKPIIHGRDHFHGGPDPIQVAWEDVGSGSGDGGGGGGLTYHWLRCTNPVELPGGFKFSMSFGGRFFRAVFWDFSSGVTGSGDLTFAGGPIADSGYEHFVVLPGPCLVQASVKCTFPPQAETREGGLTHSIGGSASDPLLGAGAAVPEQFDMQTGGSGGTYTPTARDVTFLGQLTAGPGVYWSPRFIEDDITEARTSSTLSFGHVLEVLIVELV